MFGIWILIAIVSFLFVAVPRVSGDGTSDFPNGVIFSFESDREIDEGRVFYQKTSTTPWAYTYLDCETFTLCEAYVSTKGNSYVPVGTKFNHYFDLEYRDGTQKITDVQSFVYLDNRFEWIKITEGLINVYYYGEYVENRAELVMESAQAAFQIMGNLLQITPTEELNIVVYNNYRHMVGALPFKSQMSSERLIMEGLAIPSNRVLLVLGQGENTAGVASHEFTHLLVYEASGTYYSAIPAWLNEGLSEVGNIDPTPTYFNAFRYAVMTRKVKPIWWLHEFTGTSPDEIMIAYGIGTNITKFMLARLGGPEKMAELFVNVSELGDFDDALMATYGFNEYGLDSIWREALQISVLPPPDKLNEYLQSFEKEEIRESSGVFQPIAEPQPIEPISLEAKEEPNSTWGKWSLVMVSIILGLAMIYVVRKKMKNI